MKLNKLISCLLSVILIVFCVQTTAGAKEQAIGNGMGVFEGLTYRTFTDGTATITKGNTYKSGTIEIPVEIDGYIVTAIGDYSFQYCKNMQEVIIPPTVTYIGYSAFYGCEKLETVTIPDSVTEIQYAAFAKCNSLKTAKIADMVAWCAAKIDGPYANPAHITGKLDFGTSMTNFVIPSYISSIGAYSFYGCKDITSIVISEGITEIGECAFYGCENLTNINVPKSVIKIEDGAFSDCDKLSVVDVSLDNDYYKNLDGALVEIETKTLIRGFNNTVVPNDGSIERIASYAFSGCENIASITLPDSINYLGASTFKDCKKLSSVTLPSGLTDINSGLFSGCSALTQFTIPQSVSRIGSNAFRYCTSLASIELPNKIVEIDDFAFADCTSLTSLELPGSLKKLGEGIIAGSTAITSLKVKSGSAFYSQNNCIIKNGFVWAGCKTSRIPDDNSISMIRNFAFSGQTDMTQALIPKSVQDIGVGAFDGCTALKNIYYGGDENDWWSIKLSGQNEPLVQAEKLYENTNMPEIIFPDATDSNIGTISGENKLLIWIIAGIGLILIAGAVTTAIIFKRKRNNT